MATTVRQEGIKAEDRNSASACWAMAATRASQSFAQVAASGQPATRQIGDRARLRPNLHGVCLQRDGLETAQEGRDALRASETYPGAHPTAVEGAIGSEGRVHTRRHRPKPPEIGKALPDKCPLNADWLKKPIKRTPGMEGIPRRGRAAPFQVEDRRRAFQQHGRGADLRCVLDKRRLYAGSGRWRC